jgi:hypothetical protein
MHIFNTRVVTTIYDSQLPSMPFTMGICTLRSSSFSKRLCCFIFLYPHPHPHPYCSLFCLFWPLMSILTNNPLMGSIMIVHLRSCFSNSVCACRNYRHQCNLISYRSREFDIGGSRLWVCCVWYSNMVITRSEFCPLCSERFHPIEAHDLLKDPERHPTGDGPCFAQSYIQLITFIVNWSKHRLKSWHVSCWRVIRCKEPMQAFLGKWRVCIS